jgi:hypothetical protein
MGYANSMSNDKLMTSADRFSHVQHSQYDIAELRLSSAAAAGVTIDCWMNSNLCEAAAFCARNVTSA